jgi:MerR family transcriptional regulator, light-induced transcriptional regulator
MQDSAAEFIFSNRERIARSALGTDYKTCGEHTEGRQEKRPHEDFEQHLLYLTEAVRFEAPELFIDYVEWCKIICASSQGSADEMRNALKRLKEIVDTKLPEEVASVATPHIERALEKFPSLPDSIPSKIDPETRHGRLVRDYLETLMTFERRRALAYILQLVGSGMPPCDLFDNVLTPALHEIGRLWQNGTINEAQEHFCAALTDQIVGVVSSEIHPRQQYETVVGFCVAGEQHSLGLRLILEAFATCGWNPIVVGANTPTRTLDWMVATWKPAVIAISASMTYHLREVAQAIASVRASTGDKCPKIIVGGRPFLIAPQLWRSIGADMTANSCEELMKFVKKIA